MTLYRHTRSSEFTEGKTTEKYNNPPSLNKNIGKPTGMSTRCRENPEFAAKRKIFVEKVQMATKGSLEDYLMSSTYPDVVPGLLKRRGSSPLSAPKRKRINRSDSSAERDTAVTVEHDKYCWRCYKTGVTHSCCQCVRSYHSKCLQQQQDLVAHEEWMCPECCLVADAENPHSRLRAMRQISPDRLKILLQFALARMKTVPGIEPFLKAVDQEQFLTYSDHIVKPMDLSQLEANVVKKLYASAEAFLADVMWIHHNCIVFNTVKSPLSAVAKSLLKVCKQEVQEIQNCPDCYQNAHKKRDSWFVEACRRPHLLVWAKLKGFPFWPGKAMRYDKQSVDVRFFGAHDKAWVSLKDCFLFSLESPIASKNKKKGLTACLDELQNHVAKLKEKYGRVVFAPTRTPYDPEKEEEHYALMLPNYKYWDTGGGDNRGRHSSTNSTASSSSHLSHDMLPNLEFRNRLMMEESSSETPNSGTPEPSIGSSSRSETPVATLDQESNNEPIQSQVEYENSVEDREPEAVENDGTIENGDVCSEMEDSEEELALIEDDVEEVVEDMEEEVVADNSDVEAGAEEEVERENIEVKEDNVQEENNKTQGEERAIVRGEADADSIASNELDDLDDDLEEVEDEEFFEKEAMTEAEDEGKIATQEETASNASRDNSDLELVEGEEEEVEGNIEESEERTSSENKEAMGTEVLEEQEANEEVTAVEQIRAPVETAEVGTQAEEEDEEMEDDMEEENTDLEMDQVLEGDSCSNTGVSEAENETRQCMMPKESDAQTGNSNGDENLQSVKDSTEKEKTLHAVIDTNAGTNASAVNNGGCDSLKEDREALDVRTLETRKEKTNGEKDAVVKALLSVKPIREIQSQILGRLKTPVTSSNSEKSQLLGRSTVEAMEIDLAEELANRIHEAAKSRAAEDDMMVESVQSNSQTKVDKPLRTSTPVTSNSVTPKLCTTSSGSSSSSDPAKPRQSNSSNFAGILQKGDDSVTKDKEQPDIEEVMQEDPLKLDDSMVISPVKTASPPASVLDRRRKSNESHHSRIGSESADSSTFHLDLDADESDEAPLVIVEEDETPEKKSATVERRPSTGESSNTTVVIIGKRDDGGKTTLESLRTQLEAAGENNQALKAVEMLQAEKQEQQQPKTFPKPKTREVTITRVPIEGAQQTTQQPATPQQQQVPQQSTAVTTSTTHVTSVGNVTINKSSNVSKEGAGTITISSLLSGNSRSGVTITPAKGKPETVATAMAPTPPPTPTPTSTPTSTSQSSSGAAVVPARPSSSGSLPGRPSSSGPSPALSSSSSSGGGCGITVKSFASLKEGPLAQSREVSPQNPAPRPPAPAATRRIPNNPPLRPGPIASHPENPIPPEAGPVTAQVTAYSGKIADVMRSYMEQFLRELANSGSSESMVRHLQLEMEKLKWKHQQEILEVKRIQDIANQELRQSMELEKQRIIGELKMEAERQKHQAISDTKKKQWCANCSKEAIFYCCWNTSYCDYPCQQNHWPQHMAVCAQNSDAQQYNENTTSETMPNGHIIKELSVDVEDEEGGCFGDATSDASSSSPKSGSMSLKRKRKRCGNCEGCLQKTNCGMCAPCRNHRTHQVCRRRRCHILEGRYAERNKMSPSNSTDLIRRSPGNPAELMRQESSMHYPAYPGIPPIPPHSGVMIPRQAVPVVMTSIPSTINSPMLLLGRSASKTIHWRPSSKTSKS